MTKIKKRAFRAATYDGGVNVEERTAKLTFMTEAICDNWFVPEKVICTKEAADLTRLDNGVLPLLFNHERGKVIGQVQEITFENHEAKATVRFFDDEDGEKIFKKVQDGLRGVSVGYIRQSTTRVMPGNELNGVTYDDVTDVTTKWMPFEISIVSIPADPDTGVGRDLGDGGEELIVRELEGDKKMPNENPTPTSIATPTSAPDMEAMRAQAAADEKHRILTITNLCTRCNVTASDREKYINDGTSVEAVRSALLDQMIATHNPIRVTPKAADPETDKGAFHRNAVDGLLMRSGITVDKPSENAGRYTNAALRTIGEMCLELEGVKGVRLMGDHEIAERAMGSGAFQGIVDDYANKSMMKAYQEQEFIFENFVSKGSNRDFKPNYKYEMGLAGEPELMAAESGEFKYQEMTDAKVSTQIATYGKAIKFTREIFINDQLGQVQRVINLQAAGFRRLQEKTFFDVLQAIDYSAKNGNLVATNKNISAAAYSEMRMLMRHQKDLEGKGFIGVTPKFLLASDEAWMEHTTLLTSGARPDQDNAGVNNPAKGMFTLYTSPYLEGTAYYAIAAPNQMNGIEFTTLGNLDKPQSRTIVPSNYLGLEVQMWMDFGFNVLSHKAFVKNAGE